jgi:two-component system sensor histidine kinase BaeS
MIDTLRQRLILSHVLPLLIIIPVLGIALIYVLETQILIPNLSTELVQETAIIAELARDQVDMWRDPAEAQRFVARLDPGLGARIILLDAQGRILASSDPADAARLGEILQGETVAGALRGEDEIRTNYNRNLQAEIADVFSPVFGPDHDVIGVLRLSHQLTTVQDLFLRLRYSILWILAAALVLGTSIGWFLALNMERPLRQVTQAIYGLATGKPTLLREQQGPTEVRLLLSAVNTLVERLHSSEQARRQLLANLIHELGRPLGALRAATQALLDGAVDHVSLRAELLYGMIKEIERLHRLLDDLAELHDQVLGILELQPRALDLDDWLGYVLPPWREAVQQKGLHWETTEASGDMPLVEADPDRLAQALGNLLSNAIKYTPAGGTISVKTGLDNGMVWIQVGDTGPGISPEEQAQLFTPFYRGQNMGRFPQGMGLGLTIARDLVIAHGGRLELTSMVGQGSNFTIWLPVNLTHP